MKIDTFDTNEKTLIIAEIGNNHEGNYALAEEMINKAAETGVDAVKFQTIVPEKLVTSSDTKRINQLKKFQLSILEFKSLSILAKKKGLIFLTTPFDIDSVDAINEFVPVFKIASCDNNFYPLMQKVAQKGKPIIISSGLADIQCLRQAVECIEGEWKKSGVWSEIAILHCVSNYPVEPQNANLNSIKFLKEQFQDVTIGYSDHTLGIEACLSAVALGVRIIEKHFTIDKNYSDFRDHQLSADPVDMKDLVQKIRNIEVMLGQQAKDVNASEQAMIAAIRRSMAAKMDLSKGHVLKEENVIWLRPGDGILLGQENLVLGKKLNKDIKAGLLFAKEDFE